MRGNNSKIQKKSKLYIDIKKYNWENYNWFLAIIVFAICCFGVMCIHCANSSFTVKQILGLIMGTILMIGFSCIDYHKICNWYWGLYGILNLFLVLVLVIGKEVNGSRRWIDLKIFTFQPSELAKILIILFVATYIDVHKKEINEIFMWIKLLLFCAVPIIFIVTEPDLSTTIDLIFILSAIVFVGGISLKFIRNVLIVMIPALGIAFWYIQTPEQKLLKPYQLTRVMTFLHPQNYVDSSGYQQNNSIMAIGSGRLLGKGLFSSSTSDVKGSSTGLISEQQTDFIFSVVGESLGFVGSVIVIAILALIVLQCIVVARKARDISGQLIATGMAALVCFQSFINIGVATALLPNTGLPLPFLSYGLTSLISNMMGIGVVLNISLQRRR
ncbi:MAG: FtsW/RodA/SpoVE family cell cycle protein [Lachnospiraceae bacterium]